MNGNLDGLTVDNVEIDGTGVYATYLYPTFFDASANAGTGTAQSLFPVVLVLGSTGVSDIFYVSVEPDMFSVAPDGATFIVPPGRLPHL